MPSSKEPDPSDPEAEYLKHIRVGVWDFYADTESDTKGLPVPSFIYAVKEILASLPYVTRAANTLRVICLDALILYLVSLLVESLLPATTLYYSGKLLQIVQESIDSRAVDKERLLSVLGCNFICAVVRGMVRMGMRTAYKGISKKLDLHFEEHLFRAKVRLDVPTFADPAVRNPLLSAGAFVVNPVWSAMQTLIVIPFNVVRLISQLSVLMRVLRDQPDGTVLALLSLLGPAFAWVIQSDGWQYRVWGATSRNIDFMRKKGLKALAKEKQYRQELVAGNLQTYVFSEFQRSQQRVDPKMSSFQAVSRLLKGPRNMYSLRHLLDDLSSQTPQLYFTFIAARAPGSIPVSLASLTLIRETVSSFYSPLSGLRRDASSILRKCRSIRDLYEMNNIKNRVTDGIEPYPEQKQTLNTGMAIEFKGVSFKYPDAEEFAIRNVTFNIGSGQLCVLVGFNGSGKSTILKLLARLYDPTEGVILVDGRDIKTLKLADLRQCISVLFQDYKHFPLSIKENIGMGNPEHAKDDDMIRQAAALGGATEIIEGLSEGFDTFLSNPVPDQYSGLPEGTRSLFGKKIGYGQVMRHVGHSQDINLSGGQMQRLAASRTFMRCLGSDSHVGLLLFDEPSASMDPQAEHDLFERLNRLRGSKTMFFSSHRFGQLTRNADKILYMAKSTVLELGTHDELLKMDRGYAKMYNIQAAQYK